jgi:serine/threonine-protein kinase
MTKQKNKKRLVRARMAKTGESHQAAHRAVSSAIAEGSGAPKEELTLGRIIAGRYRLLRVTPASTVPVWGVPSSESPWLLYDAQHVLLGGDVTIKLISRAAWVGKLALRPWFLREGRALQRAAHPQVIRVFDIGETEDEDLYLVLDRAPPTSLAAYLAARPMPERVALDVLRQLAALLDHVHAKGVTPRSLHDGVIYIEDRDGAPTVKIGSLAFADLSGDPRIALPDAVSHPAWMSPEECRGEDPDERSTLYTLGLVLYTMLARRLPFEHESRARLLELQRDAVPPPLRASGAATSALEVICLRLLAKEPEARYPSAAAVVTALADVRV